MPTIYAETIAGRIHGLMSPAAVLEAIDSALLDVFKQVGINPRTLPPAGEAIVEVWQFHRGNQGETRKIGSFCSRIHVATRQYPVEQHGGMCCSRRVKESTFYFVYYRNIMIEVERKPDSWAWRFSLPGDDLLGKVDELHLAKTPISDGTGCLIG